MQTGASPELPSGQRSFCPGTTCLEPGVSLWFGWRKMEDQLSPGHLDSEQNLEHEEREREKKGGTVNISTTF